MEEGIFLFPEERSEIMSPDELLTSAKGFHWGKTDS